MELNKKGYIAPGVYVKEYQYGVKEDVKVDNDGGGYNSGKGIVYHIVIFFNYDGKVLYKCNTKDGYVPYYGGNTPIKPSSGSTSYVFVGWDPVLKECTKNATYTAVFESATTMCNVNFYNYDMSLLQSSKVEYETMPIYSGDTPTRESTIDTDFTFSGWYPEIESAITTDMDYVAQYDESVRKYTVTFHNYDGTILQQSDIEYGTLPEYTGSTPTREKDHEYMYTFNGWDRDIEIVTGNADYYATYTSEKVVYVVRFLNYDGTVLQVDNLNYLDEVSYRGQLPRRDTDAEGVYTFHGWLPEIIEPANRDVDYIAQYTVKRNKYTVSFVNYDTEILQKGLYEYGTIPTYTGNTPTRNDSLEYTYTFIGWDKNITEVTGNVTYMAVYNQTKKYYTVNFKNYNYNLLQSDVLEYGILPSYTGATPTRELDREYRYTFNNWHPEINIVKNDIDYIAQFNKYDIKYVVRFYEDNTKTNLYYSEDTIYRHYPEIEYTPEKKTGYIFNGWDEMVPIPSETEEFTWYVDRYAKWIEEPKYNIYFVNYNGYILQSDKLYKGELPVYRGEEPTREKTEQYSYTFIGWDKDITEVTGDTTYKAMYASTLNSYTIVFKDADGNILQEETLNYGETPVYTGATPTKEEDEKSWYEFKGWSPDITTVKRDTNYTPVFEEHSNIYMVRFFDDEEKTTMDYSEASDYDNYEYVTFTPAEKEDFKFSGWTVEEPVKSTTEEHTYYADRIAIWEQIDYYISFTSYNTEAYNLGIWSLDGGYVSYTDEDDNEQIVTFEANPITKLNISTSDGSVDIFPRQREKESITTSNITSKYGEKVTIHGKIEGISLISLFKVNSESNDYTTSAVLFDDLDLTYDTKYLRFMANSGMNSQNQKLTNLIGFEKCYNLEATQRHTFRGSKLESIIYPNGKLKYINADCFIGNSYIKKIFIPKTITNVYTQALTHNTNPLNIYYEGNLIEYLTLMENGLNNCNPYTNFYLNANPNDKDNPYFNGDLLEGEVVIPSEITKINMGAFHGLNNITSIILHDNITEIGDGCFECMYDLTNIKFSNSLTYIPYRCAGYCPKLVNITIPNSVTELGIQSFNAQRSIIINIPNSVQKIGSDSWINNSIVYYDGTGQEWCSIQKGIEANGNPGCLGSYTLYNSEGEELTACTIPTNITVVSGYTTGWLNLYDVNEIPNTVTEIGAYAFYCNQNVDTSIVLQEGLTSIGAYAFYYYGHNTDTFDTIIIPSTVSKIEKKAFTSVKVKNVIINTNLVTELGDQTFSFDDLEIMNFPTSVTKMEGTTLNTKTVWYSNYKESNNYGNAVYFNNMACYRYDDTIISMDLTQHTTDYLLSNIFSGDNKINELYIPSNTVSLNDWVLNNLSNTGTVYYKTGLSDDMMAKWKSNSDNKLNNWSWIEIS